MRRRLLTLCSALSLLLCAAVCALWVVGYSRRDVFTLRLSDSRAWYVESVRGGVQFVQQTNMHPRMHETGWQVMQPADPLPASTRLGFGAVSTTALMWAMSNRGRG